MTTERRNVGIWGVGAYLPEQVRTNDWWPKSVVEKWEKKAVSRVPHATEHLTEGEKRVVEAMQRQATDPFKGAIERRVMSATEEPSDLETRAAQEAIERAGIDPKEIDLLLGFAYSPDVLAMPNAVTVHQKLGLSQKCLTAGVDAACNAFLVQLALAEQMIASGAARFALLIQSSTPSRILPMEEPYSAWFGDGATAVVVGPVSRGRGVIARSHRTDGSYGRTLICSVPGKRWHDEGVALLHVEDRANAHRMLLAVVDMGEAVIDDCLGQAGLRRDQVDFFAAHQASAWFRKTCQEHLGLTRAKAMDTFSWAGSLTGCNLPLVLHAGEREGMLSEGDVVAMYSGGTGIIWSGILLRWGK